MDKIFPKGSSGGAGAGELGLGIHGHLYRPLTWRVFNIFRESRWHMYTLFAINRTSFHQSKRK